MRPRTHRAPRLIRDFRLTSHPFVTAALALGASFSFWHFSAAAEIDLSGTGTFKPPSAEQVGRLPGEVAFAPADFASGTWSFLVRYENLTPDADPDPHVGRYVGAIRALRLTIGATTVELPADQVQLVVSDGGLGLSHRESIRLEASSPTPYGVMRVAWVQLNQRPDRTDFRGAPGSLPNDALPTPSMIANLATSSPFDRFLLLRIDGPGGEPKPLLYISSSNVSVRAGPAAIR